MELSDLNELKTLNYQCVKLPFLGVSFYVLGEQRFIFVKKKHINDN